MPRLSILDLPVRIRELICSYAGFTGFIGDLNYQDLTVYPLDEYPSTEDVEDVFCFHGADLPISRRQDPQTFDEYWESPYDRFCVRRDLYPQCKNEKCEFGTTCQQSCCDYFHDKSTHPELFRIMMQKNHLRICQGSPGGFQPFHELSKDVLSELGTLTVRLDGEPLDEIRLGGDWMRLHELKPYNLRSRYGKTAMKEWEKLIARLAECIRPSHLTLYIVTKASDIETAKVILKPLNKLPTLKGCGIHLHLKASEEFKQLARETVERLCSPPTDSELYAPFRYLDLPQELRYKILEFSDLVSPADLEWKPSYSSLLPFQGNKCSCFSTLSYDELYSMGHLESCSPVQITDQKGIRQYLSKWLAPSTPDYKVFSPSLHDNHCPRHCCSTLSHPRGRYYRERGSQCRKDHNNFCACPFNCTHSAYENTVRRPRIGPHPLFLVSQQVRQDAMPIFFQRNKFVITPPGLVPLSYVRNFPVVIYSYFPTIPMRRTELSIFLSTMPKEGLRHLRYVEWVLPPYENYTAKAVGKEVWYDYADTVQMMAHALNISQLTLTINLRAYDLMGENYEDHMKWPLYQPRNKELYSSILSPLCSLAAFGHGRLKNCFVYLRRIHGSREWWLHGEHDLCVYDNEEGMWEKAIMGDEYDAWKGGKMLMDRIEKTVCQKGCDGWYESIDQH